MKLIFKTNGNFYNVGYVVKIEKVGDTELKILMGNNSVYMEKYKDNKTRDKVYDDFMNEFVLDTDS